MLEGLGAVGALDHIVSLVHGEFVVAQGAHVAEPLAADRVQTLERHDARVLGGRVRDLVVDGLVPHVAHVAAANIHVSSKSISKILKSAS